MQPQAKDLVSNALISGTVAGLATAAVASLAGKRDASSYAAPLNATSHVVWGDAAAQESRPSLKYTLTGFLLNHGATIFWAAIYEKLFARDPNEPRPSPLRPLLGAAAVTAGAYVTDYYVVPRRFTPGFEKRLSGKSMALVYGVLAGALAARALTTRR